MSSAQISVTSDSCSFTLALTNETAIKVKHDKELLNKSYSEVVGLYVPSGVTLPSDSDYLEHRVGALCRGAERRYKDLKGRAKASFLKKKTRSMTISSKSCSHEKPESIKDIIIHALQEELEKLETVSKQTISELQDIIRTFEVKCRELEKKNSDLTDNPNRSKGKRVGEGSKKTDRRKLQAVGSSITQALEIILDSYGLSACQLVVSDVKNLLHKITFQEDRVVLLKRNAKRDFSGSGKVEYDIRGSPDKRKVREMAVMDSHFISNIF